MNNEEDVVKIEVPIKIVLSRNKLEGINIDALRKELEARLQQFGKMLSIMFTEILITAFRHSHIQQISMLRKPEEKTEKEHIRKWGDVLILIRRKKDDLYLEVDRSSFNNEMKRAFKDTPKYIQISNKLYRIKLYPSGKIREIPEEAKKIILEKLDEGEALALRITQVHVRKKMVIAIE